MRAREKVCERDFERELGGDKYIRYARHRDVRGGGGGVRSEAALLFFALHGRLSSRESETLLVVG